MEKLKGVYMFLHPDADTTKNLVETETPTLHMLFVGVSTVDEGVEVARKLVAEGAVLVELCGAWGYAGAKRISDEVGAKVPVGAVLYQVCSASRLCALLGGE